METKRIVKNLYFNEGFSLEKIGKMLNVSKEEVEDIVNEVKPYKIITAKYECDFRRIAPESITNYTEDKIHLESSDLPFLFLEDFFQNANIKMIPSIYYIFNKFFGESGIYGEFKSTFNYYFFIKIFTRHDNKYIGDFIISIIDYKGSVKYNFFKLEEGHEDEVYKKIHKPEKFDLSSRILKKIFLWFMLFVKNARKILDEKDFSIKPFFKMENRGSYIYGYDGDKFFIHNLNDLKEELDVNSSVDVNKKFNNLIDEAIKKREKWPSINVVDWTHEIIDRTNEESMLSYEFTESYNIIYRQIHKIRDIYKNEDIEETENYCRHITGIVLFYITFKEERSMLDFLSSLGIYRDFDPLHLLLLSEYIKYYWKNKLNEIEVNKVISFYEKKFKKFVVDNSVKKMEIEEIENINNKIFSKFLFECETIKLSNMISGLFSKENIY